jgi:hypothetical protein
VDILDFTTGDAFKRALDSVGENSIMSAATIYALPHENQVKLLIKIPKDDPELILNAATNMREYVMIIHPFEATWLAKDILQAILAPHLEDKAKP